MKKSVVEDEITIVDKIRFIPIQITTGGVVTSSGVGITIFLSFLSAERDTTR